MEKFLTYDQAKNLVSRLNHYLDMVENYEVHTKREWIIKNYALTNSIAKVIRNSKHSEYDITRNDILEILNEKPTDELQKIISKGYKVKIRRKKYE